MVRLYFKVLLRRTIHFLQSSNWDVRRVLFRGTRVAGFCLEVNIVLSFDVGGCRGLHSSTHVGEYGFAELRLIFVAPPSEFFFVLLKVTTIFKVVFATVQWFRKRGGLL